MIDRRISAVIITYILIIFGLGLLIYSMPLSGQEEYYSCGKEQVYEYSIMFLPLSTESSGVSVLDVEETLTTLSVDQRWELVSTDFTGQMVIYYFRRPYGIGEYFDTTPTPEAKSDGMQ